MSYQSDELDIKLDRILNLRSVWIDTKIEIAETYEYLQQQQEHLTPEEIQDTKDIIVQLQKKRNQLQKRLESMIK